MRFLLALTLIAGAMIQRASGYPTICPIPVDDDEATSGHGLPKLFDFAYYGQLFNKRYCSSIEALHRRALFIPRAMQIYLSGLSYMLGFQDYHYTLNEMTDITPAEMNKMSNHVLSRDLAEHSPDGQDKPEEEEKIPVANLSDGQLIWELESLANRAKVEGSAVSELLGGQRPSKLERRKRSTGNDDQVAPVSIRKLTLIDLISIGVVANPEETKRARHIPSNNPNYKPVELPTQSAATKKCHIQEQMASIFLYDDIPVTRYKSVCDYLKSEALARRLSRTKARNVEELDKNNIVYVDHSRDGCMNPVRQQGDCGSCYAFADLAIYEWLHCKTTGNLTKFSEQYVVDCSEAFMGDGGCEGGTAILTTEFVQNFGLELEDNYPYRGSQGACPIDEFDDLKSTGYIRVGELQMTQVSKELWEHYIQFGPITVTVAISSWRWLLYGRGVAKFFGSKGNNLHAMVLVGHGKTNGQEYWKLRNSWGSSWGENGYIRLYKDSPCLTGDGYVLASQDGLRHEFEPMENLGYVPREIPRKKTGILEKMPGLAKILCLNPN